MIFRRPADNDLKLPLWRNCYCCHFMLCHCFILSFQLGHLCFVLFLSEQAHFPEQVKTWEQCHTPCAQGLSHMQFTHTCSENKWILVTLSPSTCQNRWVMSKVGTSRLCSCQITELLCTVQLTSSSWSQSGRRWRGRSRPVAVMSAWGRCHCLPQRRSAPLSSPSTWTKTPGGRAGGQEVRIMWQKKDD